MTVEVTPLNVLGGGISLPTRFSDTFNRASGILGQNWIQTVSPFTPVVDPVNAATFGIGAAVDLQQAVLLTVEGTGNPNTVWIAGLLCAPIYMNNFGKSQFSEWLMVANDRTGVNDVAGGPAVLAQNSGLQATGNEKQGLFGYFLFIKASDKSYQLIRGTRGASTVITSGGAASFANGDLIRLQVVVSAGQNDFTIFKNGASFATVTDNSAGRLQVGSPGWIGWLFDNSGGGTMTCQWRNFFGGLV